MHVETPFVRTLHVFSLIGKLSNRETNALRQRGHFFIFEMKLNKIHLIVEVTNVNFTLPKMVKKNNNNNMRERVITAPSLQM
jgi:hypothetical protein